MKARFIAVFAAGTMLLAGCGGSGEPTTDGTQGLATAQTQPTSDTDTDTDSGAGAQAAGDVDCSQFTEEDAAKFAIWAQFFAQVRNKDGLQFMTSSGYSPDAMNTLLGKLDQLKGHEGEVYGKPDEALVIFHNANDVYAAVFAKGDSATDADFAPLNDLEPDVQSWINSQAAILVTLGAVCPDLA
ncbi:MAG: hypothetical protein NVV57_05255 [Demequina sp.]|jgi:hypothetical protein|nr:hypothetical protein [Demequina sp.]